MYEEKREVVDQGTYFVVVIDGQMQRCSTCGKPLEYRKNKRGAMGTCKHRCTNNEHEMGEPTELERLDEGFRMLAAAEDDRRGHDELPAGEYRIRF